MNIKGISYKDDRGFTLIELMVVMAIISVIATIGVPGIFRTLQKKDPLTQGVSDIMDACAQARAMAIMRCIPMVVKFHPYEYTFNVEQMPRDINESLSWGASFSDVPSGGSSMGGGTAESMKGSPYKSQEYSLNGDLVIEMLDVNLTEHKDDDMVISRFFPNGTSDLLTVVVSMDGEFRRVTTDMVTGLARFDNLNELATPKNPMRRRKSGIDLGS